MDTATVAGDHTIGVGSVLSVPQLCDPAPLLYGLRAYASWPGQQADQEGPSR